jgi:lysophospholipase L1-like esterase
MKNILLLCVSFCVGLVLCEALLSVLGTLAKKTPAKTISNMNSNQQLRILCIGDSVTFGAGCSDSGKSYPAQLQEKLKTLLHKDVIVINKGIPGTSTPTQLNILTSEIEKRDYDAVIFLFGAGFWSTAEFAPDLARMMDLKWKVILAADSFLSRFKIYKLIKNAAGDMYYKLSLRQRTNSRGRYAEYRQCLDRLTRFRQGHIDPITDNRMRQDLFREAADCINQCPSCDEAYYMLLDIFGGHNHAFLSAEIEGLFRKNNKYYIFAKNYLPDELGRNIAALKKKQILQMIRICKDRGIIPVFLTYPSLHFYGYGLDTLISKTAGDNGYAFIDLKDYFIRELRCLQCKEYFVDDIHPNCAGYEKIAERIAQEFAVTQALTSGGAH